MFPDCALTFISSTRRRQAQGAGLALILWRCELRFPMFFTRPAWKAGRVRHWT